MNRRSGRWAATALLALLLVVARERCATAQVQFTLPDVGPADPLVLVDLQIPGDRGALYRYDRILRVYTSTGYRDLMRTRRLCLAPCHEYVPLHATYVIDGPGIVSSDHFKLPETGGPVTLEVRPGSLPGRVASTVVFIAGVGAVIAGIFSYIYASADNVRTDPFKPYDPSPVERREQLGVALIGVGCAAAVGGVIGLIVTRTTVRARTNEDTGKVRVVSSAGGLTVQF